MSKSKFVPNEIVNDSLLLLDCLSSLVSVAITDAKGIIRFANKQLEVLTGYSQDELIGKSFRILKSGHHSQEFYKELWKTISSGKLWQGQFLNKKKNGECYWIEAIIKPILNIQGEVLGYISVRCKIAEEQFVLEELKFGQSAINYGVWQYDVASHVSVWSEQLFVIFEMPIPQSKQVDRETYLNCIYSSDKKLVEKTVEQAVITKQSFMIEHRISVDKNKIKWVLNHGRPIFDSSGELIAFRGTIQDITGQKETALLLEQQRAQMIHASRLSMLGEMVAGVAHEVNNPLTIILGNCFALKRALDVNQVDLNVEDLRKKVDKQEMAANRISKIVSGLKTFSRSGEVERPATGRLADIVKESLDYTIERIKGSGIELKVNIPDDIVLEYFPLKLSQVLINLLNNAHDAVAELSEKWIEFSAIMIDNAIRIKCRDSGNGIPPQIIDKILNPFFTTKDVGKGTGLGLSISKSIIDEHNGRLWINQNDNHTCFIVDLPQRIGDEVFVLDFKNAIEAHLIMEGTTSGL